MVSAINLFECFEEFPNGMIVVFQEDPFKESFYRGEAVEAIVGGLNCEMCDDRIQEQSARALLTLGGRFSCTGESLMLKWLLQKAGFQESCLEDSCHGKEIVVYDLVPHVSYLSKFEFLLHNCISLVFTREGAFSIGFHFDILDVKYRCVLLVPKIL